MMGEINATTSASSTSLPCDLEGPNSRLVINDTERENSSDENEDDETLC
jgi:hypothetical protein